MVEPYMKIHMGNSNRMYYMYLLYYTVVPGMRCCLFVIAVSILGVAVEG